jgi:hypothetical protein
MNLAGSFCPVDLDCDGTWGSGDTERFEDLFYANDPFCEYWDGNAGWHVTDMVAFLNYGNTYGCQ